jgi:hypothetical protein
MFGLLLVLITFAAAAPQALTSVDVRNQFSQCGYEIANAQNPANTPYIVLRDPGAAEIRDGDYRIVMAIVYRDVATANAAHERAHRDAEQTTRERWPFSDDNGPQLLTGYGGSVWRGNVALVESSYRTLASMFTYDSETEERQIARPELFQLGFVKNYGTYAVDRDFVSCLEEAAPLTAMPALEPNYLQGHPW